jgi:23S rRNA (uridine2552-2'-O)-methyltransferase
MARSKSSQRWLKEHFDDPWVARAQQEGYRSRASYKLLELDKRDRLLRPGMRVVDLGAAPGGWSQIAADRVGRQGEVVALDILEMAPIPNVTFLCGDFTEEAIFNQLLARLPSGSVDLVLSDMAPNMSGVKSVDQPRAIYLAELALDLAGRVLHPGGNMVIKLFQGSGSEQFIAECRCHFTSLAIRKPEASRGRSSEVYLVARGWRQCQSVAHGKNL